VFVLATREDHIVPWRSAYRTLGLVGGRNKTFVLGASGHIAGVVNPAAKNRRNYWVNDRLPALPAEWLAGATERAGSWWTDWDRWLAGHAGDMVKAPGRPGNAKYKPIEDAPGRYVKFRVV
jgi:polyhydroxyalkanoate synthase